MKLIQTKDYLLLIDEEAEIKKGDYILEKEYIINVFPNYLTDLDECKKLIAYRPRTKEAKKLDLPWLPNPFIGIDVKQLAEEYLQKWRASNIHLSHTIQAERCKNDFIAGYKAAQSKQFSLEDMKEAFNAGYDLNTWEQLGIPNEERDYLNEHEYIQLLSAQKLPKEFIPEYKYYYHSSKEFYSDAGFVECSKEQYESIKVEIPTCPLKTEIKTITNSEGKQEIQGEYIW